MANCAYCNTTILFGGRRQGDLRFCNAKCEQSGVLAHAANQLPAADVQRYVRQVHGGVCPRCAGPGPVDVHTSYRVWSAVFLTSWASRPTVSCSSCGNKKRIGDTLFSLLLGWWGLPWGILVTPMQLGRNIVAFIRPPDPLVPSAALEKLLRLHLASQLAGRQDRREPDV